MVNLGFQYFINFLGFQHKVGGVGGGAPPPAYTPMLDYSDDRNSQYVIMGGLH